MAGINRLTGKLEYDGWAHTQQSIVVLMTTALRSRVMRRGFGADMPRMVDRAITPATVIDFYAAAAKAIANNEPRFRVNRMSVEAADAGRIALSATGTYYPRGHLGDFSVAVPATAEATL